MQKYSTQQLLGMTHDDIRADIGTGYSIVGIYCSSRGDGRHSSIGYSHPDTCLPTTDPSSQQEKVFIIGIRFMYQAFVAPNSSKCTEIQQVDVPVASNKHRRRVLVMNGKDIHRWSCPITERTK